MSMQQLSEIMINGELLKAMYREPSITAYNRLESRPRSQNFERSLRAEIRDPLWMLTRQWQMGEFEAEDTGSAIDARLLTKQIHVDRIAFDHTTGRMYSDEIPMETFVERETLAFKNNDLSITYGLRVKMGHYFLKLHSAPLRTKYEPRYREKFAMEANREGDFRGQTDGLNIYLSTHTRAIDGAEILEAVLDGSFTSTISIDGGDTAAIDSILTQFKEWFARQYSQPANPSESAWHSQTLDYQFSLAAPYAN
jgi:hypothetical protein